MEQVFAVCPSVRERLYRMSENAANATFDAWCEMLADVELIDAQEIVAQLKRGDLILMSETDRIDVVPRRLRELARETNAVRRDREYQSKVRSLPPSGQRKHLAADFIRELRSIVGAKTEADREQATERAYRASSAMVLTDEEYGPRYACPICTDTGVVPVKHGKKIQATACNCKYGDAIANEKKDGKYYWQGTPRFDPDYDVRA